MKVLLMVHPNVGKSVVFNRLTGMDVIASNYPGTIVEYTQGSTRVGTEMLERPIQASLLKEGEKGNISKIIGGERRSRRSSKG